MATFSFRQDVKVSIWARQNFNIEAETYEEALRKVERYKTVDVGTDDMNADVEWLFETWEPMEPGDNANNATIELYDNGNVASSEGWCGDKLLGTNALQSDAEESSDDEYSDADFSDYDEYTGHCWNCTREDFESEKYANYDLSDKSDEEIHQMIDEVVDMMQNDYVSEMYWQCINDVAEAHSLKKWYSPSEHDKAIVEYVSKYTCIDQREIDLAYDYIEQWRCPLDHASQRVYDAVASAIDDWLEDNCIATDGNHWVDAEEIFNQVEKWELKKE